MLFRPNPSSGVPIYLQLMEQVKHSIETGALRPGEQLPGIRPLAEELVINPNTVAKAYRELEHEGVIELRHGAGAFVSGQARAREGHRKAPGRSSDRRGNDGTVARERYDRRGDPAFVRSGTGRVGESRRQWLSRSAIETVELAKRYDRVEALRGLNLRVPSGSIFGFLGRNGAGKTTTIKVLLGMARPTSGLARVFGMPAEDPKASVAIRTRTGFVSDEKDLFDYMTVDEMIRFTAPFFPRWRKTSSSVTSTRFELPQSEGSRSSHAECGRSSHCSSRSAGRRTC